MTHDLDDLVGQSLMLSFPGPEVTPELHEALAETRPAGVVLFADNLPTAAGGHALVAEIQGMAAALGLPPLLVAVDQEGGLVGRLPEPFVTVPSQMAQAATGDADAAYECARITGHQLRSVGISVNFAPVLDVNRDPANPVIGTRSFGDDPAVVARFGDAALRGYRAAGVVATAKHFPGHGDTSVDSHLGLPTVGHDRDRLRRVELAPFAAAIRARVPAIMTAHIVFSALDHRPATLSPAILTDLLRRDLAFDGVVFTDAMEMRAVADRYGSIEAVRLAKAAGADVVLAVRDLDGQAAVARGLREAVADGTLPEAAFAATARRLERLRSVYGFSPAVPPFAPPDPALAADALAIAQRGVTIVGGRATLPLAAHTRLALVDCLLPRWSQVEEAVERAAFLRQEVVAAFPAATAIAVGPEPTADDLAAARRLAAAAEAVLLVTRDARTVEHQERLGRELAAAGSPLIHAAVRGPYDAALLPGAAATLLTYGDPPVSLRALVAILAGRARAEGRLPVALPSGAASNPAP